MSSGLERDNVNGVNSRRVLNVAMPQEDARDWSLRHTSRYLPMSADDGEQAQTQKSHRKCYDQCACTPMTSNHRDVGCTSASLRNKKNRPMEGQASSPVQARNCEKYRDFKQKLFIGKRLLPENLSCARRSIAESCSCLPAAPRTARSRARDRRTRLPSAVARWRG